MALKITRDLQCFGVEIRIAADNATLYTELEKHLPPGWTDVSSHNPLRSYEIVSLEAPRLSLSINAEPALPFGTMDALLDFLEGDIQLYVAEFATPHLFVHAGVVAVDGRAIMIPGRSFAGKSTLTTSLVKAGATYYSDEYAVLDDRGYVIPYPRRVSLRNGPHGEAGRLDFSHLAPQGPAEDHAIPVGLVALLRYDEEDGWDIRQLDHLPAIMAIGEQTVAIQRRPADTLAILDKVVQNATVIQGTRGEVDNAVDHLLMNMPLR